MKSIATFFKGWGKWLVVIIIGFIGGILGALIILQTPLGSNSSSNSTTVAGKVVYNNSNSTTKAVEKVQGAVVSVINYQKTQSSSSDLYGRLFGGDSQNSQDNSSSSDTTDNGLSVNGEGSGVIYKKDGDTAYLVTNNHVIDGAQQIEIQLSDGTKVVGELVGADTY